MIKELIVFIAISIVFYLIYKKYKKNLTGKDIFISIIIAVFLIIIYLTVSTTNTELPNIQRTDSGISIGGYYGTTIDNKDITEITLTNDIPKKYLKIDGLGLGKKEEGLYKDSNNTEFRFYVTNMGNPPYILIKTSKGDIYINSTTAEATEDLYKVLKGE